jgi:hypothetical protein
MSHVVHRTAGRFRRLWIGEALLVAAILVFGGFALLSDARVTPSELLSDVSQFVSR